MDSNVKLFSFWFAFLIFLAKECGSIPPEMRHQRRLFKDLLTNYDVDERPVLQHSDIVNVTISLAYRELLNLDEPTQTLKSNIWLRLKWKDVFLEWNPIDYGNHSLIRIDPRRVWTPDMTLYNNVKKEEKGGALYNFQNKLTITSDGEVTLLAPVVTMSTCRLAISRFPFDKQSCHLKIGSWTHDGYALDLFLLEENELDLSIMTDNTEWEILSTSAVKNVEVYHCCAAPFYDAVFTIHIRRKPLYYIMTTIIPCVVLSLLASVSFFFPADSGERISFVMSVLLGLIVFMLIINENTPINSESVPLITQYFHSIGMFIFLCLLATGAVIRIHNASNSSRAVGRRLATTRDILASLLCIKQDCRYRQKPVNLGNLNVLLTTKDQTPNGGVPTRRKVVEEEILYELRKLLKRAEDDDLDKEKEEEWKYTARVFDRFFLVIFLLMFFAITFSFLAKARQNYIYD